MCRNVEMVCSGNEPKEATCLEISSIKIILHPYITSLNQNRLISSDWSSERLSLCCLSLCCDAVECWSDRFIRFRNCDRAARVPPSPWRLSMSILQASTVELAHPLSLILFRQCTTGWKCKSFSVTSQSLPFLSRGVGSQAPGARMEGRDPKARTRSCQEQSRNKRWANCSYYLGNFIDLFWNILKRFCFFRRT